ncbi:MAG: hypothetical protein DI528_16110 [Shinella sp.]|nr:MAG: hypothetical protein DI528_16110 [Shinella sp.]
MQRRRPTWQTAIRALCALALFAVGFAHQVPAGIAPALSASEIAALTLPDGTLPELCLPGQDQDGKTGHKMGMTGCEACIIAASTLLPVPVDITGRTISVTLEIIVPERAEALHRQLFPPNAAPRAPPLPAIV